MARGLNKTFPTGQLSDTRTTHKEGEEPFGDQTPHTEASDAVEASMLFSTSDAAAQLALMTLNATAAKTSAAKHETN